MLYGEGELFIHPIIQRLVVKEVGAVGVEAGMVWIDEVVREEVVFPAGLLDVLVEQHHVVEVVLQEALRLQFECIAVLVHVP